MRMLATSCTVRSLNTAFNHDVLNSVLYWADAWLGEWRSLTRRNAALLTAIGSSNPWGKRIVERRDVDGWLSRKSGDLLLEEQIDLPQYYGIAAVSQNRTF
jgi:hypothetical protein